MSDKEDFIATLQACYFGDKNAFNKSFIRRQKKMRLKEIRKNKGISQLKLAIELNTNQNTISRYETGEREPGINELIKIADYFNVSIDYLLGRTDNPKINK